MTALRQFPSRSIGLGVGLAVAAGFPVVADRFWVDRVVGWVPLVFLVAAVHLVTVRCGQTTVGHGGLLGLGAYAFALVAMEWQWSATAAVVVAALASGAVGLLMGLPAVRLAGLPATVASLAVAVLFPQMVERFSTVTGGSSGMLIVDTGRSVGALRPERLRLRPPEWTGLAPSQYRYLVFALATAALLTAMHGFARSRVGRAMSTVRDREYAAAALGVDVAQLKISVFAVSGLLAGCGGALWALDRGWLSSGSFPMTLSFLALAAAVTGGRSAVIGPLAGGLFLGIFQDVIGPALPARFEGAAPILLGLALIGLSARRSSGIVDIG